MFFKVLGMDLDSKMIQNVNNLSQNYEGGNQKKRQDNSQNGKVDWLINEYRNKIKVIGENRDVFLWVNWTMIHWCAEIRIPGLAWQASSFRYDLWCTHNPDST